MPRGEVQRHDAAEREPDDVDAGMVAGCRSRGAGCARPRRPRRPRGPATARRPARRSRAGAGVRVSRSWSAASCGSHIQLATLPPWSRTPTGRCPPSSVGGCASGKARSRELLLERVEPLELGAHVADAVVERGEPQALRARPGGRRRVADALVDGALLERGRPAAIDERRDVGVVERVGQEDAREERLALGLPVEVGAQPRDERLAAGGGEVVLLPVGRRSCRARS